MDSLISQHQQNNIQAKDKLICTRCEQLDLECIKPGGITKKLFLMLSAKNLAHSNCLRRQIMLALLFTAFPLCGICITDLTFVLITPDYVIPPVHIVIGTFLLLIIVSAYIILLLHAIPRSATSKYLLQESEKLV